MNNKKFGILCTLLIFWVILILTFIRGRNMIIIAEISILSWFAYVTYVIVKNNAKSDAKPMDVTSVLNNKEKNKTENTENGKVENEAK